MKKVTTITIDVSLINEARARGLNVSKVCNDSLRAYLNSSTSEDIDYEILLRKEEATRNRILELTSAYTELKAKLESFKQKEEERRMEALEAEKERIMAEKNCLNCGNEFNEDTRKPVNMQRGNVCRACFLASTKEQRLKWNGSGGD